MILNSSNHSTLSDDMWSTVLLNVLHHSQPSISDWLINDLADDYVVHMLQDRKVQMFQPEKQQNAWSQLQSKHMLCKLYLDLYTPLMKHGLKLKQNPLQQQQVHGQPGM